MNQFTHPFAAERGAPKSLRSDRFAASRDADERAALRADARSVDESFGQLCIAHSALVRSSVVLAALAWMIARSACAASAQVMDVGVDGRITLHDGAGIYTDLPVDREKPSLLPQSRSPPGSANRAAIDEAIRASALKEGVDQDLAKAVAWQESRDRPAAISPKGAIGVMQLEPRTAQELGVDPTDPLQNIAGGVSYLRALLARFHNNEALALAAYNAGPAAVQRYGGAPPFAETRSYVRSVLGRRRELTAARKDAQGVEP